MREASLRVALAGQPGPNAQSALADLAGEVTIVDVEPAEPDDITAIEALLIWDFRWRSLESLLPAMPALRWAHTASAGVDHLLTPPVRHSAITVTNSAGIFDRPIAEYVLAIVLAHAKGLLGTIQAQSEHRWAYRETLDIHGRVMAVVGLGHVGRAVADLAAAAGMHVIGVRQTGAPVAGIDVVTRDRLVEVLRRADFVVVAAALTPETTGMIGAAELAAMKPSAYLVNVARGPIVDAPALLEALASGSIAGAALDVFDDEPLPSTSPLWSTPGLLVSPHMAGDSAGWDARVVQLFAANVRRFRSGHPLLNVVDLDRGY